MTPLSFATVLAILYGGLIWWASGHLPGERWQIAAAIPIKKNMSGAWQGVNFTYYGIFTANALVVSAALVLLLLGSLGVSLLAAGIFLFALLSVCLPAARILARWVEKKPATLTIGGAGFVGIILAPWLVYLLQLSLGGALTHGFMATPVMAALAIAYIVGEGLGRLACLSFGCCYGRPLSQSPSWARALFWRLPLVFTGFTKKAAYESGLEGKPVLPVQVMTSLIYGAAGLLGIYLFFLGQYAWALWITVAVAGLWRAFSETLRADFRGAAKFTAYQRMALAGTAYASLIPFLAPAHGVQKPVLSSGLDTLWDPGVLLVLQGLWLVAAVFSGTSKVTSSTIEFHLVRSRL